MKIGCCIDMMFSEFEFYKRFEKAASCGFKTVEFWKWTNKDIDRVSDELEKNDLKLSIFNLDSRDEKLSADLMKGILNQGRAEEFVHALKESIPVYKKWGADGMIVLIGETLNLPYEEQIENIIQCLKAAAPIVEEHGVTLLVEPLNSVDRKNYFLPTIGPVAEILREVNSPNIKLLFDLYHEYTMTQSVEEKISQYLDLTGHFHIADSPGRHEPGTAKMDYDKILKQIEGCNYTGNVGLEYRATIDDEHTFAFVKNYLDVNRKRGKLKAAVICCGMIANSAHLPAYKRFDDLYEVVAVCDMNKETAQKLAEKFHVANVYTDAEEMLKIERPDVVSVCAPNMLHKKFTLMALEYGANVLCEKPLAFKKSDAEEMFRVAKEKGKLLMACQSWRFMPERIAVKKMIDAGEIGDIYHAEFSRIRRRGIPTWGKFHIKEASGGGAFLDIGVHVLDALIWLLGNPKPISVTMNSHMVHEEELGDTKSAGDLTGSISENTRFAPSTINVETFCSGRIHFENGLGVNFKTAWAANTKEENNIVILGRNAGVDIENKKVFIGNDEPADLELEDNLYSGESFYGHFYLIKNMAKAIAGEEELLVKPEETINLSAIMEAAYISAEKGGTVTII